VRAVTLPVKERGGDVKFALLPCATTLPPSWLALVTLVPEEVWNHALYGYTEPLNKLLGRAPLVCLRKVPEQRCDKRGACAMHDPNVCLARHDARPWCFEVSAYPGATEVLKAWSEGVYVLLLTP